MHDSYEDENWHRMFDRSQKGICPFSPELGITSNYWRFHSPLFGFPLAHLCDGAEGYPMHTRSASSTGRWVTFVGTTSHNLLRGLNGLIREIHGQFHPHHEGRCMFITLTL